MFKFEEVFIKASRHFESQVRAVFCTLIFFRHCVYLYSRAQLACLYIEIVIEIPNSKVYLNFKLTQESKYKFKYIQDGPKSSTFLKGGDPIPQYEQL